LALGYATAPIGPRYDICEHDWDFDTSVGWDHSLDFTRTLGILERIPMEYIGAKKVRNFKVLNNLWSGADALGYCIFAIAPTRVLSLQIMTDMLGAITGWETSSYEILRWGERRNHIMRVYNNREGLTAADDWLPERFFDEPIDSGVKGGIRLDREAFKSAIKTYYEMMGWDEGGIPRPATLYDHHLEWTLSKRR
jgi:aldehyde:ferredoxin oxidoreductase